MLSVSGRKPASVVIEPIARILTRLGLSPNTVTVAGTCITIAIVVTLIPLNHLVWAAIFSAIFSALDMVDGTMARMRGAGTQFGATLDATCDRLTDGALFGAITWWLIYTYHAHPSLIIASFVVLVTSQVISYVKARGEASGFTMVGGLIERPERLILALGGIGLTGLGVPYAIDIALWVLAVGSVYTVIQRLLMAAHSQEATQPSKPPAGAREFPPQLSLKTMPNVFTTEWLSAQAYLMGWKIVGRLPLPLTAALCTRAADYASDDGKGMNQLRKNLSRVVGPENVTRTLVRDAMRSYARYWLEAFRLPQIAGDPGVVKRIDDRLVGKTHLDAAVAAPHRNHPGAPAQRKLGHGRHVFRRHLRHLHYRGGTTQTRNPVRRFRGFPHHLRV